MATTLTVSWPANPASEQVTKYHVRKSVDGGAYVFHGVVNAPATSVDIVDPTPGVYSFKVLAENVAGVSAESDPVTSPGLPSKPGTPAITVTVS